MTVTLTMFLERLAQWTYPRALRLEVPGVGVEAAVLAMMAARAAAAPPAAPSPAAAPVKPPADAEGVSAELATALATQYHRMSRTLATLETQQGGDAKEVRSMKRHLRALEQVLRDHHVEVLDLTGEPYSEDRRDFESASEAVAAEGATARTINYCDRPAVRLRGRLVQTARGVVAVPR